MALIADDARDRAEQMSAATARLTELIAEETRRIEAREPPLQGEDADEKARLANAYRLELSRIKQDPRLIEGAPPALLSRLREETLALQETLGAHETALGALRLITEGLVQAMAEEITRQRGSAASYGARGQIDASPGATPALIDRTA